MEIRVSEEQTILRDTVRRFVETNYSLEKRRDAARSKLGYTPALWEQIAALGLLLTNIPEVHGGLGLPFSDTLIVAEELGYGMVLEPYLNNAVLCSRILEMSNQTSIEPDLISNIASGSTRVALAHSEVASRYNLSSIEATATPNAGGGFTIQGAKVLSIGAPSAQLIIVSAKMPGENRPSLFLIPANTNGVRLSPYPMLDDLRAADVILDQVIVAPSALIARAEDGLFILEDGIDRACLASVALSIGSQRACLDITSEYVKLRHQFNQPIGKFQAIQHIMADMFVGYQASRSALLHAIAKLEGPAKDRQSAISAAKIVVGRNGPWLAASAIQLHGGYGFTDEYAVSHHYRYQLAHEKLFGDVPYHQKRFAALNYGYSV